MVLEVELKTPNSRVLHGFDEIEVSPSLDEGMKVVPLFEIFNSAIFENFSK